MTSQSASSPGRRSATGAAVVLAILAGTILFGTGCATYSQDLDRARRHYQANEFEPAVALFRALEADFDSLSASEQAQYAYLRGMASYRLSTSATVGSAVQDPKAIYRANARYWLGISAAMEKNYPGSMNPDEKERLEETLTDLNKEVYGIAPAAEEGAENGADAEAGAGEPVADDDGAEPAGAPAGADAP